MVEQAQARLPGGVDSGFRRGSYHGFRFLIGSYLIAEEALADELSRRTPTTRSSEAPRVCEPERLLRASGSFRWFAADAPHRVSLRRRRFCAKICSKQSELQ